MERTEETEEEASLYKALRGNCWEKLINLFS